MNWVGGVKRRVIMKEEEQRRQQEFFAKQSVSARKGSRIIPGMEAYNQLNNTINAGVGKRKADILQYKRINVDKNRKIEEDKGVDRGAAASESYVSSKSISRRGVRISHNLKLSSCHTAFSEMLIKMEYKGSKEKMKVNEREEKRKFRNQKEIDSAFPRSSLGELNTSISNLKTPQRGNVPLTIKNYDKITSGKFWKNVNLLEGAPRMRRVLSLSPGKFNGKRIWSPIPTKDSCGGGAASNKRRSKSNSHETLRERERLSDATFAEYMVAKILKSPTAVNCQHNEATAEDQHERSLFHGRKIEPFEGKSRSLVRSQSQPNSLSIDRRHKLSARNVIQRAPRNEEREPPIPMSSSGKIKLSDCTRKLFVLENSFKMKNRVDMTPYIDNEPVTSLWTPSDVRQSMMEESETSFKTPSDPTFADLKNISLSESNIGNDAFEEVSTPYATNNDWEQLGQQYPEDAIDSDSHNISINEADKVIQTIQSSSCQQYNELTDHVVLKENKMNITTTPFVGSLAALKILAPSTNEEPLNCRSFTAYEYNEVMTHLISSRGNTDKEMLMEVLEITSSSSSEED